MRHSKEKALYIFCLVSLLAFSALLLLPTYWMIKGGFENIGTAIRIPPKFILMNPTLVNYRTLFFEFPVFRWIANSVIVAAFSVSITVFTCCLSGYAFAKKEFPGKELFFWLLLSTIMIAHQVRLIPLFIIMKQLGLHNTYPGIFLPGCASVGNMFMARQYMSTIPSELLDSARMDGASEFRIFMSIIVPISKPLVAVLCIFTFVGSWIAFLWPLIMTSSESMRTLPIGVVGAGALPGDLEDIGMAMAGATLVAVPLIVVFASFQKYFTKGITLGGVKG